MSNFQEVRLAQFFRHRLEPLIRASAAKSTLDSAELYEAIGWLDAAVFCGFVDANDADFVWVRLVQDLPRFPDPEGLVPDGVLSRVHDLVNTDHAFRKSLQMLAGPQREFEAPLFRHALLTADRMAADKAARRCTAAITLETDEQWNKIVGNAGMKAQDTKAFLVTYYGDTPNAGILPAYLRLLDHMTTSAEFFEHAKAGAGKAVDFESYCRRIGSLNSWRVPIHTERGRARLRELRQMLSAFVASRSDEELGPSDQDVASLINERVTVVETKWEAFNAAALIQYA